MLNSKPFARYLLVGALGFAIDATVLQTLLWLSWPFYGARAVSVCTGISICYLLHQRFTFSAAKMGADVPQKTGRFQAFVAAQMFSGALNYATSLVVVWVFARPWFYALVPSWAWLPKPVFFATMGALCAGTGVGLLVNYVLAKKIFVNGLRLPFMRRGS